MYAKHIVVFGGGIAGLTVAHELVEKGFQVTLYEQDNILGGMARSRREKNDIPSEHSWRGYAPFYSNTFDLMKRIPIDSTKTVYDNLSKPITFYIIRDEISSYFSKLSLSDYFTIGYLFLKYLCADKRRNQYFETKIIDLLKPKLSDDGYRFLIDFICGPGYGIEKKDASFAHYFKLLSIYMLNTSDYKHSHKYPSIYTSKANDKWHVMNKPTSEAWFDPWEKYLISRGVKIIKGVGLKIIISNGVRIIKCIGTDELEINGDDFVICINPFAAEKIFYNSSLVNLAQKFNSINAKTSSKQVAFRLGFNKTIKFPEPNIAFIFPDSEFNITLYPQEQSWNPNIKLDSNNTIKSLWSGTILELYNYSKLFNTQGFNLTKDQLMQEIIHQIIRSKSLQKLLIDTNGSEFSLTSSDITYSEIWYEWDVDPKTHQLEQLNKKWVTNIYNQKSRPDANTEILNLYLGGSHCNTSIEVWSMEGAVESGKKVANTISQKYNISPTYIKNHQDPNWTKPFKFVDNILYKLGLPNLVDWIILALIIFIFWSISKKLYRS